jgi:hypothetical protein
VDASQPALVRHIHHLLCVLSVANEVWTTANRADQWSTVAAGVDGKQGAISFGLGHDDAW